MIFSPLLLATVVMLPADNLSGSQDCAADVARQMSNAAVAKGWRVITSDQVEPILEQQRVRYLDSLAPQMRKAIVAQTRSNAVLSTTVYTCTSTRNSIVAVSARLSSDDGTLLWCDVAGLSADDTERLLGFGRMGNSSGVVAQTVKALMKHFPQPGAMSIVGGPSKPAFKSGPVSYRARGERGSKLRICVLPFENQSMSPEAPRVVSEVLALRFAAAKNIEVVEPSAMRAAALEAHIGSFRGIDSDQLARLAPLVGTSLFLSGTIYTWVDPASRNGGAPELSLEVSLVDVRTHKVLWAAEHARKGTDYIGFLMLGNVSNAVALADRVATELVQSEEKR